MSLIQRVLLLLLPRRWAASMEAESRSWMAVCPCGRASSVWDRGGIRWRAAGEPRRLMRCAGCGRIAWHRITRRPQGPP